MFPDLADACARATVTPVPAPHRPRASLVDTQRCDDGSLMNERVHDASQDTGHATTTSSLLRASASTPVGGACVSDAEPADAMARHESMIVAPKTTTKTGPKTTKTSTKTGTKTKTTTTTTTDITPAIAETAASTVMGLLHSLRQDVADLKRATRPPVDDALSTKRFKKDETKCAPAVYTAATQHLRNGSADIIDMQRRIAEFVRVHGGGHEITRNGSGSQTSLRMKCTQPTCQFRAVASCSVRGGPVSLWFVDHDKCIWNHGLPGGLPCPSRVRVSVSGCAHIPDVQRKVRTRPCASAWHAGGLSELEQWFTLLLMNPRLRRANELTN